MAVAGYENPQEGYRALAEAIRNARSIYPEDILQRFIETAKETGKFEGAPEGYARAIQQILRGGIFNDSGVGAYARPCTPMILGLMEIAAQSHHDTPSTCFILASADISNLGGLNLAMRNRRKTDTLLQHLAQKPDTLMNEWAQKQGYEIQSLMIRTGGDEFKSIYRITRKDGQPIDNHILETQLIEAAKQVNEKTRDFAERDCGLGGVAHTKKDRASGVTNTIALRALNPHSPAIAEKLQEMEADLAAARKTTGSTIAQTPTDRLPHFPTQAPPPGHSLESVNPYDGSKLNAGETESLEQYSLRMALAKTGFPDLAERHDLFSYDTASRRTRINQNHEEFESLSPEQKNLVLRVIQAEELRGVMDPVSRSMSAAFLDQSRALHFAQCEIRGTQPEEYEVELKNLGGMNRLGESLGDAVLHEVGKICESAFFSAFNHAGPPQKPAIAQQGGGLFRSFIPPGAKKEQIQNFARLIEEGIEQLNQMPLQEFLSNHKVRLAQKVPTNVTTIATIENPSKAAHEEVNNSGLTIIVRKGEAHGQKTWQRRAEDNPTPTPYQSL
jgi:hypothetical protein